MKNVQNTKQAVIERLLVQKEIYAEGDKTHQDSFWYDGAIAYFKYGKREVKVIACGDIRINNKKGELVYDGKERGSGIKGGLNNDKDLRKIGNNYTDKYYWENNNWFEILTRREGKNWEDGGEVQDNYDNAIENAKELLFDDEFWGDK